LDVSFIREGRGLRHEVKVAGELTFGMNAAGMEFDFLHPALEVHACFNSRFFGIHFIEDLWRLPPSRRAAF
jgi:hypothetical protein